jgi:FkbM family methyltransferase
MNLERFWLKCKALRYIVKGVIHPAFSQSGEDIIVQYLFRQIKITSPTYLDIGTNHPIVGNNTYLLYLRGSTGVCIEPDPELCREIRKKRPKSKLLQAGIGIDNQREAALHVFPPPYTGWNTFSHEEAKKKEAETGVRVKKTLNVPLLNINDVIRESFHSAPDFLSIDIEGLDLAVLQTLDFQKHAPAVICAETIAFSTGRLSKKQNSVIDFLETKNYIAYADTYLNTIFCRKTLLQ